MEKLIENSKMHSIELRGLEDLLRKRFGQDLSVLDYETTSLLPLGENYGSTIYRVRATVKKTKDKSTSNAMDVLDLVAKMMPSTDFQRIMFDSAYTFKKETFLYEQLIPSYRQLEREFGVTDDQLFDIVPELYGVRYTMKADEDIVDDDAVILMQNLKVEGYYTCDRKTGLNYEHGKVAIIALARFHALGIVMKQHRSDFFAIVKERARCLRFSEDMDFESSTRFFLDTIQSDQYMSTYYDLIDTALHQDTAINWTAPPPEPWSTIVHSDFWINNIMFRKESATGCVSDVKFVDFQNYLFLSSLRELVFFVMTNFDENTMEYRFDELINCYYVHFIDVLKKMRCDTEPFAWDKFKARLKIDAYDEFPHCPFMIKAMTNDASNHENVESLVKDITASPAMIERLRRCVKKYIDKGWLQRD